MVVRYHLIKKNSTVKRAHWSKLEQTIKIIRHVKYWLSHPKVIGSPRLSFIVMARRSAIIFWWIWFIQSVQYKMCLNIQQLTLTLVAQFLPSGLLKAQNVIYIGIPAYWEFNVRHHKNLSDSGLSLECFCLVSICYEWELHVKWKVIENECVQVFFYLIRMSILAKRSCWYCVPLGSRYKCMSNVCPEICVGYDE